LGFFLVLTQGDAAHVALDAAQGDALAKDVHAHDFFFANSGDDDLSFLRKTLAALDVKLVLVAQAAHQPAARPRDLGRVERQPLILRYSEIHGPQLRKPRRRAVLPAAAPDSVETLGLVTDADLFELDAGAKERSEIADEIPEVDALVSGEIERELLAIPLP